MRRRDFLRTAACAAPVLLGGCAALPRSGPTTAAVIGETEPLDGLVADLDRDVVALFSDDAEPGFSQAFLQAAPLDPTRLGAGDLLDISVWETEGGLFAPDGGLTLIEATPVETSGDVFVPFIGAQRAAGLTPAQLRGRLRTALEPLSLSPEVDVRLTEPRSRLVTLQGAVAEPGILPVERPTRTLSTMIAAAGGATEPPERVEVAIQRGGVVGREILARILDDPAMDIALRPDDRIVLSPIRERFIALGAASVQAEIPFTTRPFDLLAAIGASRGLRDFDADPTGVFVFRWEDPAIADAALSAPTPAAAPDGPGRPIVYRLDLSRPEGFFFAREFPMRDGDALFVTNAPLTELRKILQLFNSVVAPVTTVDGLGI